MQICSASGRSLWLVGWLDAKRGERGIYVEGEGTKAGSGGVGAFRGDGGGEGVDGWEASSCAATSLLAEALAFERYVFQPVVQKNKRNDGQHRHERSVD